jgi:lauroyl/myristoyl acyltransferase
VSALFKCLSLGGLYRFGRFFGTVEWLINYKRRRRFVRALKRVWGREPTGSERRRATREHFAQSRCDKLFYLVFDRIPRQRATELLSITNRTLLDEATKQGRGVYMAMSHHGALHVLAMLLSLHGYKTAGVRDRHEGPLRRYVQRRVDQSYPDFKRMRVIFADAYPREVFRCLQDGYVLGSAIDVSRVRRENQRTEEITVFGEKRSFLSGPLRVAYRCKTPVLQAFVLPEPGFRYRLEIVEVLIDPETTSDESTAVSEAMRRYAHNLEECIRKSPSLLTRL